MYASVLAIVLGVSGWGYSAGVQDTEIRTLVQEVSELRKEQTTVTDIQVEQAVQGAAIDSLKDDVGEIKETQKEISSSVEMSRREVNRLSAEQQQNFRKILEAVQ